jgi:hypothetical protein
MKTQNSQEPPPAWMEDALAMMELSAEVTAALAAAAGNGEPEAARPSEGSVTCSAGLAELGAVQTQLEDAWTALCKQDWGAATQNVFDARASVTKLADAERRLVISPRT